jgi:feruloyl-CoA synthase
VTQPGKEGRLAARIREVRLGPFDLLLEHRPDGTIRARSPHALGDYPSRLTERLEHWAEHAPARTFLAKRDAAGAWRRLTYADTLEGVRRIGRALLDRGLSAERPLAILSDNDLEHALLALGAQHVGVPYAPISPAYSLVSNDYGKLREIIDLITPGLVFAASGAAYRGALEAAVAPTTEIAVTTDPPTGRAATSFADLLATAPTPAVEMAAARVGPDTIAKFLFTSGSTGRPKAVINTQRMLCSNQAMIATMLAFLQDEPPVMVDWLPWHHTAGGNHNIGLVLWNGGTLYIDDGRPTAAQIGATMRSLREIATTFYVNVPKGFEMLLPSLTDDAALRERFFSRMKLMFYAGAHLAQHVWEALQCHALETTGERILMLTGLGATETAPFVFMPGKEVSQAGEVGLPAPGIELKLVPLQAGRFDVRLKGSNVTPGYWRQPEDTAAAFDDEGYYRLGDALRFLDPRMPEKGFVFDGRLAEDFKLSTGTWVHVGELRRAVIARFAPLLRDAVIAGHDRDEVTALLVPDLEACRRLRGDAAATDIDAFRAAALRRLLQERLDELAGRATGSSNRVARALLLEQPLSLDAHEVTDKGSINQGAVLVRRAHLVTELYAKPYSPRVLVAAEGPERTSA